MANAVESRQRVRRRRREQVEVREALSPQEAAARDASRRKWIIVGLTLAAPLLGGAGMLWSQAILAVAIGCLFLAKPPVRSLGALVNIGVLLLVLLAATAFLPGEWWRKPDWRSQLGCIPGLELPGTRSPQPWLSLEAMGLLVLGLSWAYYVLAHVWDRQQGGRAARIFGAGIVVLAAISVISFFTGSKISFWPTTENSGINFGFFANRNQTANVLALGGVIINALAFEDLRSHRKSSAFWFASLGLICAALIFAYSRSGIVFFFGGVLLWALFSMKVSSSIQGAALAISGAVLLLTILFLFGGESLQRFQGQTFVTLKDFRLLLQKDAVNLAAEAPIFGHGLGNFEPLFAMARSYSTMGNRAVHPESDWMWAAVELGWLAPIALFVMFVECLRKCFPLEQGTGPLVRCAAVVGVVGFACHGLVDVSGHRLGSLWPALFVMSLAFHPDCARYEQRWVAPVFRFVGAILVVMGISWIASNAYPLPTSAYYKRLVAQVDLEVAENEAGNVIATATRALRIAPLDWDLYFQRARAHAVLFSTGKAASDFAVGRTLEPNWNDCCFEEGSLWLALDQTDRAIEAWREALKRPADDALVLYRRMLEATSNRFEVRDVLREWAREKRAFLLLFLETSARLEFELESDQLLSEDAGLQSLSSQERVQFFRIWSERRRLEDLVPVLFAHPEWQAESWPYIARFYAEGGDLKKACDTVKEFASMPPMPSIDTRESIPELERTFYVKSKDLVNGLALLYAQMKEKKVEDSLATINVLKEAKSPPRYLFALEFDLEAKRNEWEKAWRAWLAYESASR